MLSLDTEFFKQAIQNSKCSGKLKSNSTFSVDSRELEEGQIFIALSGKNVDGHDYILDAVQKGASGIIINLDKSEIVNKLTDKQKKELFIAQVPNTRQALLDLAGAWRIQFDCAVVGITGSVGKTSTKEMLANILQSDGKSFIASKGNQNTLIGIALNILRLRQEHKIAIFEMGISARSEMEKLAALVRPTIGLITFIGHSHMEGLGSLEDICKEKNKIFKYFKNDNIGIINGDQPILSNILYTHPVLRFGCKAINQIQARKIQVNSNTIYFTLKIYNQKYKVVLQSNNLATVNTALAAASIAQVLGINAESIVKGIEKPIAINSRFKQVSLKSNQGLIIDDSYNANPESMKAALLAFEKIDAKGKKIAVLGDMLELGITSSFWHRQLGRFLRKVPSLDYLVLVGDLVNSTKSTIPLNLKVEHFKDWQQALEALKKQLDEESVILVKGSRSMQLKCLVNELGNNSL